MLSFDVRAIVTVMTLVNTKNSYMCDCDTQLLVIKKLKCSSDYPECCFESVGWL